jgi:hypothetical protein
VRVYELGADLDRFNVFAPSSPKDDGIYSQFNTHPIAGAWRTVEISAADADDSTARFGDYTLLGTIPVFSLRALEVLAPVLKENGEVLPLRYRRGEFLAYNVTRVLDALNEEESLIERFPSSGRVMSISRYVFLDDFVQDAWIFKIPQQPRAFVFVTQRFVDLVEQSRLTGFEFRLLS